MNGNMTDGLTFGKGKVEDLDAEPHADFIRYC
jgi:hypothetical protein